MSAKRADGQPVKVVIIDDDQAVAYAATRVLSAAGYSVTCVVDPAALLEVLAREQFALCLVDIHLGGPIDGIDLVANLPTGVPVLYISGDTDDETLARAANTRCRGFVSKPFTAEQLRAAVRVALGPQPDQRPSDAADPHKVLSTREREVVDALVMHGRIVRVAKALSLSEHTVRNHVKRVFEKLHVHSQEELLDRVAGKRPPRSPRKKRRRVKRI
jgi:DNA-binding NarL/FixJ family response regulator